MSDTAVPALDTPNLPLGDYRAMREGRSVERVAVADQKTSEAPPAEKPPAADAESGAGSEPAKEPEGSQDSEETTEGTQDEKKPAAGKRGLVDEVVKLRRENRELKTRVSPPPQTEQPKPAAAPVEGARAGADDPEPDQTKYTDYDKYNRDLIRWELRQSQREAAETAKRIEAQNAQQSRIHQWQQRISAASVEMPDFETVALDTSLPVTQIMGDAIMRSDVGPRVLYHLGTNPTEAARIAKLDPIDQLREIGKLEVALAPPPPAQTSDSEEKTTAPTQATSRAPAPIPRPAGSGTKTAPTMKNLEGISQAEYRVLRESGRLR